MPGWSQIRRLFSPALLRATPSVITFLSLTSAFTAIVLVMEGRATWAAACILVSYLLDAFDGALARRMRLTSDFGLQLDSLADVVAFGVAPTLLLYHTLDNTGIPPLAAWAVSVLFVCGGAFRLARFNLLPTKTTFGDSMGLTISTAGATLTLAVQVCRAHGQTLGTAGGLMLMAVALALLMVSRIRFPALASVLRRRRVSVAILSVAALTALRLSPPLAGLGLTGGYISFGLIRAIVQRAQTQTP